MSDLKVDGMLSNIALANIEALAKGEIEGEYMDGKADRFNDERNCVYQCVDSGSGCYYAYTKKNINTIK